MTRKSRIAALSLLATATFGAAASQPAHAQAPAAQTALASEISALRSARTVSVTETCSLVVNSTHTLAPCARMEITFARPNLYRVSMTYLLPGLSPKQPSMMVSDGSTVSEYISLNNQYLTRAVSSAPSFRLSPALSLDTLADLDQIPGAFHDLLTSSPTPTASRTLTQTTLDSRPVTLTDIRTSAPHGARVEATGKRLWCDASSGLPVRYETYEIAHGQESITKRLDYSNWVTAETPAPLAAFAWTPPAGATAYHPKELLAAGTPAPDFTVVTPDGKSVRLSDFKGKPVVLDFWATWCHPCQEAMPHLENLYRQVKDRGVAVLAVCVMDKRDAYDKWVTAKKGIYTFPTAFDTASTADANIAESKYGLTGIPAQYVIDKDGKVVASYLGYEKDSHQLEDALLKVGISVL